VRDIGLVCNELMLLIDCHLLPFDKGTPHIPVKDYPRDESHVRSQSSKVVDGHKLVPEVCL